MKYSFLAIPVILFLGALMLQNAHRQFLDEKTRADFKQYPTFHSESLVGAPSPENGSESRSSHRQRANGTSATRSQPASSPPMVSSVRDRQPSPLHDAQLQLTQSGTLSEGLALNSPSSISTDGDSLQQSSSADQTPSAVSLNALANQRLPNMPAAIFESDSSVNDPAIRAGLDEIAQDFVSAMESSGLTPDSIAYLRLWNLQQLIADTRFKTRFGGAAWMKQHLATRVISTPQTTPAK
jgi:hypothetical protein